MADATRFSLLYSISPRNKRGFFREKPFFRRNFLSRPGEWTANVPNRPAYPPKRTRWAAAWRKKRRKTTPRRPARPAPQSPAAPLPPPGEGRGTPLPPPPDSRGCPKGPSAGAAAAGRAAADHTALRRKSPAGWIGQTPAAAGKPDSPWAIRTAGQASRPGRRPDPRRRWNRCARPHGAPRRPGTACRYADPPL